MTPAWHRYRRCQTVIAVVCVLRFPTLCICNICNSMMSRVPALYVLASCFKSRPSLSLSDSFSCFEFQYLHVLMHCALLIGASACWSALRQCWLMCNACVLDLHRVILLISAVWYQHAWCVFFTHHVVVYIQPFTAVHWAAACLPLCQVPLPVTFNQTMILKLLLSIHPASACRSCFSRH